MDLERGLALPGVAPQADGEPLPEDLGQLEERLGDSLDRLLRLRIGVRLPGDVRSNATTKADNGAVWQVRFGDGALDLEATGTRTHTAALRPDRARWARAARGPGGAPRPAGRAASPRPTTAVPRDDDAMSDELQWDPPGPGMWFPTVEHLPAPMCGLLEELLPHAATGWAMASERYGLAPNAAAFGASCRWGFYSPGTPSGADVDALDARAAVTLAERSWRGVMQRWHDDVRPRAMARSRALVTADVAALDDAGLAAHVAECIEHWRVHAPLHFDAVEGALAAGELMEAAREWGLDPVAVLVALAGSATATSSAERLFDRIAAGLDVAGADELVDLEQVRTLGGDAAAALDELLTDYGWRVVNLDLAAPTLAERPAAVLTAIRAARRGWSARRRPDGSALEALRAQVPEGDRARFDELAAEASATYGYNDDNSTVYFALPAGIVRRAVLEVGRRLVEREAAAAACRRAGGHERGAGRAARRRRAVRGRARRAGRGPAGDGRGPAAADARRAGGGARAGAGPEHAAAGGADGRVPERGLGGARHEQRSRRRHRRHGGGPRPRGRGDRPDRRAGPHGAGRRARVAEHHRDVQHDLPGGRRGGRAGGRAS